jgi:lipopolysaccharide export system permease protein
MKRVYITVVDPATGIQTMSIYALTATWQGGDNWALKHAYVLKAGMLDISDAVRIVEIKADPESLRYIESSPDSLNFEQLRRKIQALKAAGAANMSDVRDAEVNLWNKICLPIASVVFALVGSALGFRPQRSASRGLAMGLGVFIIFCYYALFKGMEVAATNGQTDPFLAAGLPVLAAAGLGCYLIARTKT